MQYVSRGSNPQRLAADESEGIVHLFPVAESYGGDPKTWQRPRGDYDGAPLHESIRRELGSHEHSGKAGKPSADSDHACKHRMAGVHQEKAPTASISNSDSL